MKPAKRFNCVMMKWEIQKRLLEEFDQVPPGKVIESLRLRIEKDRELSEYLKRVEQSAEMRATRR